MDHFSSLLNRASLAVAAAAVACRLWEEAGDPYPVADTAWEADEATTEAVAALAGIDSALGLDDYPESRLGRLVIAARLLVLAGTDEGGTSQELEMAAQLLRIAGDSA